MKKSDLIKLKKLLNQELERRDRINYFLDNNLIQEFLSLNKIDISKLTIDNWSILEEILKNFEITETNGILVWTGNYRTDWSVCYEETNYTTENVDFDDSEYSEYRVYRDIENEKVYKAYLDKYINDNFIKEARHIFGYKTLEEYFYHRYGESARLVSKLEKDFIIINPYNTNKNRNGFKEVQKDFFVNAVTKGQPRAKELILSKYPHNCLK